mmetsp:Transcript_80654/g.228460  ORF Transcript_80654/g.228460 Transcript_80654/m.228460 type:complete len:312 (-) Transcript_80654:468-1403(-)
MLPGFRSPWTMHGSCACRYSRARHTPRARQCRTASPGGPRGPPLLPARRKPSRDGPSTRSSTSARLPRSTSMHAPWRWTMCGFRSCRSTRSSLTSSARRCAGSLLPESLCSFTATGVRRSSPATTVPKPPRPRTCAGASCRSSLGTSQCSLRPSAAMWWKSPAPTSLKSRPVLLDVAKEAASSARSAGDGCASGRLESSNSSSARRVFACRLTRKAPRSWPSMLRFPTSEPATKASRMAQFCGAVSCSGLPRPKAKTPYTRTAVASSERRTSHRIGSAMCATVTTASILSRRLVSVGGPSVAPPQPHIFAK